MTSGRFDSQVANSGAGVTNFLFQPSTTLTAGVDRWILRVNDQAAAAAFVINSDGTAEFGTAGNVGGQINILPSAPPTTVFCGLQFLPVGFTGVGGTMATITNAVAGAFFGCRPSTNTTNTSVFGAICRADHAFGANTRTYTNFYGAVAQARATASTGTSNAFTNAGGLKVIGFEAGLNQPATTNWHGVYIGPGGAGTQPTMTNDYGVFCEARTAGAPTNEYGIYVQEKTRGGTIKNGAFFACATTSYHAIAIRDQNAWIGSDAAGEITIGGTTCNIKNTNIGFFGTAGIAKPSAYTQTYSTADKTHANLTSAALTDSSGGTANTTVQALTNPADTPASADALRDDLVANLIPELRNNFADLAAQVNALIADVTDVKQLANALIDDLQALGLVG